MNTNPINKRIEGWKSYLKMKTFVGVTVVVSEMDAYLRSPEADFVPVPREALRKWELDLGDQPSLRGPVIAAKIRWHLSQHESKPKDAILEALEMASEFTYGGEAAVKINGAIAARKRELEAGAARRASGQR